MALHNHTEALAAARAFWAPIAKEHDWYSEPFYVQIWVNESGEVTDSVAHRDMISDHVIQTTMAPFCAYCASGYEDDGGETECRKTSELDDGSGVVYCYQCEGTIDDDYGYVVEIDEEVN